VQGEIQSPLDGIKIIIETIAPWKNIADSLVPAEGTRGIREGPATNTASGSRPYGKVGPPGEGPLRGPIGRCLAPLRLGYAAAVSVVHQ